MSKLIPQIVIGPDYFRTTVRKESAYPLAWRWTKETLQNSFDAGAKEIIYTINEVDKTIEIEDNGHGMDEETLVNIFLSIGGSKKDRDIESEKTSVGGFGDAKKIVCFCWDYWEIHTRDNFLSSDLLGIEVKKVNKRVGTRIKVKMGEDLLADDVFKYLGLCQTNGVSIVVNIVDNFNKKKQAPSRLLRNRMVRELGYGKLYVNKSNPTNLLVVRMNGLALFYENLYDVNASCVLELENVYDPKSTEYPLNVTRERLNYRYSVQLNELIREITNDQSKALKPKESEKVVVLNGGGVINGVKRKGKSKESASGEKQSYDKDHFVSKEIDNMHLGSSFKNAEMHGLVMRLAGMPSGNQIVNEKNDDGLQGIFPYDIIIKGTTKVRYNGIKYQKFLLAWHKMIQNVCYYNILNDVDFDLGEYKIGFLFDEDHLAQRAVIEGIPCYLLNPTDLSFQLYSWRGIVNELLDRATHEVAHHFCQDHNGNFSATWGKLKRTCNWYIDQIYQDIGNIIRCKGDEILSTANMDEVFPFEDEE